MAHGTAQRIQDQRAIDVDSIIVYIDIYISGIESCQR
jgi:hypothetical protein